MECRDRDLENCFPVPVAKYPEMLGLRELWFRTLFLSLLRQMEELLFSILYQHRRLGNAIVPLFSSKYHFDLSLWCMKGA
jgi:hypothetical protein